MTTTDNAREASARQPVNAASTEPSQPSTAPGGKSPPVSESLATALTGRTADEAMKVGASIAAEVVRGERPCPKCHTFNPDCPHCATIKHMDETAKIVATWPEWKQRILEDSGKPTLDKPREPVDNSVPQITGYGRHSETNKLPAPDEPTIVGHGVTSKHLVISWPAWGDRPVTIMQTAGGYKTFDEPRSIDEIAAEHASHPVPRESSELPSGPGAWRRRGDSRVFLVRVEDGELIGCFVEGRGVSSDFHIGTPPRGKEWTQPCHRGGWLLLTTEPASREVGKFVAASDEERSDYDKACDRIEQLQAQLTAASREVGELQKVAEHNYKKWQHWRKKCGEAENNYQQVFQQLGPLRSQLTAATERADKLQAFKDWVHNYLDEHGVPHHPPGTHGAAGCRIGDRMDWLMAQLAALRGALTWRPGPGNHSIQSFFKACGNQAHNKLRVDERLFYEAISEKIDAALTQAPIPTPREVS